MLTYRGSVNRWECDENDHMNVRYCVEKLYETFVAGLIMTNNYGALELSLIHISEPTRPY